MLQPASHIQQVRLQFFSMASGGEFLFAPDKASLTRPTNQLREEGGRVVQAGVVLAPTTESPNFARQTRATGVGLRPLPSNAIAEGPR